MGFQQGLSGLNSASKFLDVIGNNVANANTVGYKGSRAEFSDIYANTLVSSNTNVGIGGRMSTVAQQFAQGNLTNTNNPLDIAITGNGFFRMIDPAGTTTYTRNGQFQLDRNGYIVNSGSRLAGYSANSDGQLVTGVTPGPIRIQTSNIGAQATGGSALSNAGLTLGMNFDARSPIVTRGTSVVSINSAQLDSAATVGTQVNYQIRVSDPTGQFHTLAVRLENVGPNTWSVATDLDNTSTFKQAANPLVFNPATNQLVSGSPAAISYTLPSPGSAYGSTPFNFSLNFAGIIQSATPNPGTIAVNDTAALNTTVAIYGTNLDAASPVGTSQVIPTSFMDPDGNTQPLYVQLTKSANNTWTVATGTAATGPFTPVPGGAPLVFNDKGQLLSGSPIPMTFDYDPGPPVKTMNYSLSLNGITQLNSAYVAGNTLTRSTPPVVPSDPTTFTHSTSATVYDSQGVAHTQTFYFTKVGVNAWEVQTSFDGAPPVTVPGYVTFDASGKINGGTQFAYTSPIPAPSGAQNPLAYNVYYTGTTQFGSGFGVNTLAQDGYADGTITGLSIGKDGIIQGRYSNGQNRLIGQIVMYNFANIQGLQSVGDNRWVESFASGPPRLGTPGSADLGQLQSGAVEDSNIDLTKELVDMITAQRTYQANAQTIRTQDQILQTLVNLR